jgi:hypothetical protein
VAITEISRERSRRGRRDRSRDDLLDPEEVAALVNWGGEVLAGLKKLYADAVNEAVWPSSGGEGVRVTGGSTSNPTRSAALSPQQYGRREDARVAVAWIRQCLKAAYNAETALLGQRVEQPTNLHPQATMTRAEFERRRRIHLEREEELRK